VVCEKGDIFEPSTAQCNQHHTESCFVFTNE
jgi:hypothetical protein